jgi:prevent-host-death family protein
MAKSISAADANREFSAVLRHVREGHSYTVTSHGRPVARIVPFAAGEPVARSARTALFKRLKSTEPGDAGRWTRDELYEDRR